MNGVVPGQVKSVEDPRDEGRVLVEFPWMGGRHESHWAPVATLMGGSRRGAWFMPEVGDEVLVAFDRGDVAHPYVVGFLHNGADRPPNADVNHEVRRLRTPSGHQIDFDDRTTRLLIRSANGHTVDMDDAAGTITIETPPGMRITIDSSAKITIDAPSMVEVNTAHAKFSGLVEAPMVRTQLAEIGACVAKQYVNAPGNQH